MNRNRVDGVLGTQASKMVRGPIMLTTAHEMVTTVSTTWQSWPTTAGPSPESLKRSKAENAAVNSGIGAWKQDERHKTELFQRKRGYLLETPRVTGRNRVALAAPLLC